MTQVPVEPRSVPASATAAAPPLKRRGMLLGVGVTVAAGAVAAVSSRLVQTTHAEPETVAKKGEPADGYRLSAHVQRYYETTRV